MLAALPPSHATAPFRPGVLVDAEVRPPPAALAARALCWPGLAHRALGLRKMATVLALSAAVAVGLAAALPWGWPGFFLLALLAFRAVLALWWLSLTDALLVARGDVPTPVRSARMDALATLVSGPLLAQRAGIPGLVYSLVCLFFVPVWVISSQHDAVMLAALGVCELGGAAVAWLQLRAEHHPQAFRPRLDVPLVLLMALLTGLLAVARLSARTFDTVAVPGGDRSHVVLHNQPLQLTVHLPADWKTATPMTRDWPLAWAAASPDGACRADMALFFAPPLPGAVEGLYVDRVLAWLLGAHVVETTHGMFVTMQEARQSTVVTSEGTGVVTLARRGLTWHALALRGDAAHCREDWSVVRSSWSLLPAPVLKGP